MRPLAGARALVAAALACACAAPALAGASAVREIDPAASKALFTVTHVFVEHVTGTVPILDGSIVLAAGSTIPISVTARLDPRGIKTGEDDRDGTLQTADWFDTQKFGVWTFTSTSVTSTGTDRCRIDGLLTIHGVARPERLDVTVGGTPAHPRYHAVATIDRHAFGMNVTRLDPAIGDTVDVVLDVALR